MMTIPGDRASMHARNKMDALILDRVRNMLAVGAPFTDPLDVAMRDWCASERLLYPVAVTAPTPRPVRSYEVRHRKGSHETSVVYRNGLWICSPFRAPDAIAGALLADMARADGLDANDIRGDVLCAVRRAGAELARDGAVFTADQIRAWREH